MSLQSHPSPIIFSLLHPWLHMLHAITGYSNNTPSCSELNGKHAGEGFRSIRHILTTLWACKSKKCQFSRKLDLWPDLTMSNVDLGLKTICAITRSHRDASTVFFPRSSTTIRGRSPEGGRTNPPPPPLHWRRWRNTENGRGLKGLHGVPLLHSALSNFSKFQ